MFVFCTCDRAEGESVPWQELDYTHRATTRLVLENRSTQTVELSVWPQYELPGLGEGMPDSLVAGDSLVLVFELFDPLLLVPLMGYRRQVIELLPTLDRHIIYGEESNTEAGPNAVIYAAFNQLEALDPLTTGTEVGALAYADFIDYQKSKVSVALDSAAAVTGPPWLRTVLREKTYVQHLNKLVSYTSYRAFFFGDTLIVPDSILVEVDSVLNGVRHDHTTAVGELLQSKLIYERHLHPSAGDEGRSANTKNTWALATAHLEAFPQAAFRNDAVALLAERTIRQARDFQDRQLIIDTLRAALPIAYREELDRIALSVLRVRGDESKVVDLLNIDLLTPEGAGMSPFELQSADRTLYKFWFKGCYPCLLQQPYEQALLEAHPDLEIIYVCFKTRQEDWLPYLQVHPPPTEKQLFVPDEQTKLIRDALGGLGAPQYVMTKGQKVVCRNCPFPNDGKLEELLR